MYESGCIYRDNRLVNWDARLFTAVSDIEVDYIDIPGRTLINVPGYDQVRKIETADCMQLPVMGGGFHTQLSHTVRSSHRGWWWGWGVRCGWGGGSAPRRVTAGLFTRCRGLLHHCRLPIAHAMLLEASL